jgi:hypothetical protein
MVSSKPLEIQELMPSRRRDDDAIGGSLILDTPLFRAAVLHVGGEAEAS